MRTFRFQGLLTKQKDGHITGPMSPILAIKEVAKEWKFKIHGLVRVENDMSSSTYDHLITKTVYSNDTVYRLFVDMGVNILPVAIWFEKGEDLTITPIYKENITKKATKHHALNVEDEYSRPIMILSDDEFKELFKQANKSDEFKLK